MLRLERVDVDGLLSTLGKIPGASFRRASEKRKIIYMDLAMPLDLPPLRAVIDIKNDRAYIDVARSGKYTPIAYLAVCDVLAKHDLQPLMPARRD